MRVPEHITAEIVERYRLRQLPPPELLAAQTHAALCDVCRLRLAEAAGIEGTYAKVRAEFSDQPKFDAVFEDEPEHLPDARLTAFVDGSLDDVEREIAESHLSVCAECAGDVADLRLYAAIASASRPGALPAVSAPAKVSGTLRHRLLSFDFITSFGARVPAAAVAVVVAAVLLGLWIASHRNTNPTHVQVTELPRTQQGDDVTPPITPPTVAASESVNPEITHIAGSLNRDAARPELFAAGTRRNQLSSQRQKLTDGNAPPVTVAFQVALNDGGGRVTYDSRGDLQGLGGLTTSAQSVIRRSLATQRVEMPRTLNALARGESGVLMSGSVNTGARGGVPFALIGPVGRMVREARPVLRWRPLAGASSYRIAVVDSNFQVIAESQSLAATEWTPPEALGRGHTYYWQVTATLADGSHVTSPTSPAPQAKFRVLDGDAADELRRLEESVPESHLARGVLYARAGLLDESEEEFRKLVSLNPRSVAARRLLQSVRRK